MKPTLLLFTLSLHTACGAASTSPRSPVDEPSDSTPASSTDEQTQPPSLREIRLGMGPDANVSEDWVQSTVFVWWRDDAGEHRQHLLTVDSGSGEGAGDFARLDELEWPEGEAVLEANRPSGTVETLYYNQGRTGWLGLHLVESEGHYRLVIQRYVDERMVAHGEGTVTFDPAAPGYDVRSEDAAPALSLPPLPEG